MRFMTLIKSAEDTNLGAPPPMLFQAIARLGDEEAGGCAGRNGRPDANDGRCAGATGRRPGLDERRAVWVRSRDRRRVAISSGSKQEAIDWATRFVELHREHWNGWQGETEVRRMIEPQPVAGAPRG